MEEKKRFSLALSVLLVLMPTVASANVVWPSLFIVSGINSWYIILSGLIVELLFIKFILKESWIKSSLMAFGMNLASTVIGLVAIPASGFVITILLGAVSDFLPMRGFAYLLWGVSYILAIMCNVFFEGLFLKWVFKLSFRKNVKWLTVANAVTVILAIIALGFTMDRIYN